MSYPLKTQQEADLYKVQIKTEEDIFTLSLPFDALQQDGGFSPGSNHSPLALPAHYKYIARKPGGGMKGGIYKDSKDDRIWLIKEAGNAFKQTYLYGAVQREVTVANLFNEMGIEIPFMKTIRGSDGKLFVASEFTTNLVSEESFFINGGTQIKPDVHVDKEAYQRLFLYSALLGSWDFFTGGNVRFRYDANTSKYHPVMIDIGEALGSNSHLGEFFPNEDKHYTAEDIRQFLKKAWPGHINNPLVKDITNKNIERWMQDFLRFLNQVNHKPRQFIPSIEDTPPTQDIFTQEKGTSSYRLFFLAKGNTD